MLWNTKQEYITPEKAQLLLARNADHNRKLRPSKVTRYAEDMKTGQWKATPEPIIFDWNGTLINGQHRLNAIVESGTSHMMFIVRDVDPEIYDKIDRGAQRSPSDALGLPKKYLEVAAFFCRIYMNQPTVTDEHLVRSYGAFSQIIEEMGCRNVAGFTQVSIRLGAVLQEFRVKDGSVVEKYHKFVSRELYDLPPVFSALGRNITDGVQKAKGFDHRIDNLCRSNYAFNPKNKNSVVIRVHKETALNNFKNEHRDIWENYVMDRG